MTSAALVTVAESWCGVAEFHRVDLRSAKISSPEVRIRREPYVRQQRRGYLCTVAPLHGMGHKSQRVMVDIERNELKVRKERSIIAVLKSQKSQRMVRIRTREMVETGRFPIARRW